MNAFRKREHHRGYALVWVLLAGLSACGRVPTNEEPPGTVGTASQKIVGGSDASAGTPVTMAAIVREIQNPTDGSFTYELVCSGTLIDQWHVLTAAHCFTQEAGTAMEDWSSYRVKIASNTLMDGLAGEQIDAVFRHPGFRLGSTGNDVAVVRTLHPTTRLPVTLATSGLPTGLVPGAAVTTEGYGRDASGWPAPQLQTVDLVYYAQGAPCKAYDDAYTDPEDPRTNSLESIADTELCVGKAPGDPEPHGTCSGDSGGPVLFFDGSQYVQVGITSYGAPRTEFVADCGDDLPDVYTSVSDNIAFINTVLGRGVRADLDGDGTDDSSLQLSEGQSTLLLNVDYDDGVFPVGGSPRLPSIDTGIPIVHAKGNAVDYLNAIQIIDEDGDSKDDVRIQVGELRADFRGAALFDQYTLMLTYNGLPSSYEADGRFLTLATRGLETVYRPYARFYLISEAPTGATTPTNVYVSIFDGNVGGYWDTIGADSSGLKTCARLYPDPLATGEHDDALPAIGSREYSGSTGDDQWLGLDADPSTPEIDTFMPGASAFNGTNWGLRLEVFLAPETTSDGHNACDDPPETQPVPDGVMNLFKVMSNVNLRVSDIDLSFMAVDSTGDYAPHTVGLTQWKDTTYQGFFNLPFYVGGNANWATFYNADADDQDHPAPAIALGKNHEIHSRIYAFRNEGHLFYPASEYPGETAAGRPSGGYWPSSSYENGDHESVGLSLHPLSEFPPDASPPSHKPVYGAWLWQNVNDSNNVHVWIVRGSPQHLDFVAGGRGWRGATAARTRQSWASDSSLSSMLPVVLGSGEALVPIRTAADATAVLGGAEALRRELLAAKLNLKRAAQYGEALDTALLYGTTIRVASVVASGDELVAGGSSADAEQVALVTGRLSALNSGEVTYISLPTDDVGSADPDGDGLIANVDNCPLVSNADQADTDGNGIGDACEPTPFVKCVFQQTSTSYRAVFGYENEHKDRRITVGENNRLTPGLADRGQPRVQYLGGEERALTVPFTGQISWCLAGHTATAKPSSPKCAPPDLFDTSFAERVVAYTGSEMHLGDRVQVLGGATIANGGTGVLEIGATAVVGPVKSQGNVWMRSNSKATGAVVTAGTFDAQPGAEALAGYSQGVQTGVPPLAWKKTFPAPVKGDVRLEPGQHRVLTPGSYGELSVKASATATLGSGTYYFTKWTLESGSQVVIDDSAGPVNVYVSTSLTVRGTVQAADGEPPALALVYFGTIAAYVETSLTAAVAAPNAELVLGGQGYSFVGQFFAARLTVRPDCHLTYASLLDAT